MMEREKALAEIRADINGALASLGIPKRWLDASFDGCPDLPPALVVKARAWAENPSGILCLLGVSGCGKTYLSACILRHAIETGAAVRDNGVRYFYADALCISEHDYLCALKARFEGRTSELHSRVRRAGLLVFDDLGATRLTDWGRGEVAGLIEKRHADNRPTIISSNLDRKAIGEAIDPRVASRLGEDRQVWQFPARDLRVDGTIAKANREGQHHV